MVILLISHGSFAQKSQCYGSVSNGRLSNGVQLPLNGKNFTSYAHMGHLLGRTYVHSTVKTIVLKSYELVAQSHPSLRYKYAETGFSIGGIFKPHKTHQNGLSVDFMVPVKNDQGESIYFPTVLSNKYGYAVEFNNDGKYQDYQIDFKAMAVHIIALDKAAKSIGYGIKKVIFDPVLQKHLHKTQAGKALMENVPFSKKRVWVRHDEHYHVDFDVPCLPIEK